MADASIRPARSFYFFLLSLLLGAERVKAASDYVAPDFVLCCAPAVSRALEGHAGHHHAPNISSACLPTTGCIILFGRFLLFGPLLLRCAIILLSALTIGNVRVMGNACWPPCARVKFPTGRQMLLTSAANNETHEFYNSSKCVANLLKVCDPKATTSCSILSLFPARSFLPRD